MKKNDILPFLSRLLTPALLIALGITLLVNPDSASVLIAKVIGWILVAVGVGFGIAALTSRIGTSGKVFGAIVCIAIGSWLLNNPLALASGIGRFAGILLVIRGIQDIADAGKRHHGTTLAVLTTVLGAVLLLLPMTTSRVVFSLCGVVMLIIGAAMLVDRLKDRRRLNEPEDPNIIDAL